MCAKRKEKEIREFLKALQKMRENFSKKTKKPSLFESLKLVEILIIFLVTKLSLNTPIYRRGLGFKDKPFLRLIRMY